MLTGLEGILTALLTLKFYIVYGPAKPLLDVYARKILQLESKEAITDPQHGGVVMVKINTGAQLYTVALFTEFAAYNCRCANCISGDTYLHSLHQVMRVLQ